MKDVSVARHVRQLGRADQGQAMVLTALVMTVLLLMAGLGVDVAYLHYQKQQMQKAADAGAIAGASVLAYDTNPTHIQSAAKSDTQANGFTDQQSGVTVTVHNPPQTPGDPFLGNINDVEVIVQQFRPTFFMQLLGWTSVNVRSRAIAESAQAKTCVYILDQVDAGAYTCNGSCNLNVTCGMLVNSASSNAVVIGMGGSTVAKSIGIVGGYMPSGGTISPNPPTTGIVTFTDPLAGVIEPTIPACGSFPGWPISGTQTISANYYCGGIQIGSGSNVTMMPGTYIMNGGGFSVASGATVTGNGVTIFLTGAPSGAGAYAGINISPGSTVNLTAPTDGNNGGTPGILFFEDRNVLVTTGLFYPSTIWGGAGTLSGAFYFPTSLLNYYGMSIGTTNTAIVAYELMMSGSAIVTDIGIPGGSPVRSATLIE